MQTFPQPITFSPAALTRGLFWSFHVEYRHGVIEVLPVLFRLRCMPSTIRYRILQARTFTVIILSIMKAQATFNDLPDALCDVMMRMLALHPAAAETRNRIWIRYSLYHHLLRSILKFWVNPNTRRDFHWYNGLSVVVVRLMRIIPRYRQHKYT